MSYKEPPTQHQWKKGQSGNKNGRPKGSVSITSKIKEMMSKELYLKDPIDNQMCRKEIQEIIALQLVSKAIKGDIKSIETIINRIDGKNPEEPGIEPLDIKIRFVSADKK